MAFAVNAVQWVLGKALAPVMDDMLETWASIRNLDLNIDELKKELLYTKVTLNKTQGFEICSPELKELMLMLQQLAYDADDVLDELDYFRIQDVLESTFEAYDEHSKGPAHNLVRNARHTAKAVGKLLRLPACRAAPAPSENQADGGEVSGHKRKRLPCSSLPTVLDPDAAGPSGVLIPCDEIPKLEFNRMDAATKISEIVKKMKSMRTELQGILTSPGPNLMRTTQNITHNLTITTSESIESKLYGRELIIDSIIHDITKGKLCDKDDLTVLPIFGQPGIGKTTLTQHIFHNPEVTKHFVVKVWVCVSQDFNVDKLLKNIVKFIPQVDDEKVGTSGELIGQRLKSKRFLLVLDDMWKCGNEDEWKRLLLPFKKSQGKGNIIVVTTRFPALAEMVKTTDRPIEVEGLEQNEFEKLFFSCIFHDDKSKGAHSYLLDTGKSIMNKLKGSPLAAKTVGRLLRKHLDPVHWTTVLESEEWNSETNDNDIMPALKLSYHFLPFHLQQCFMYCALFPEDYKFDKERLIYFWIGLDILQSDRPNKSIEDIGLSYLNDLVSYGFLKEEEEEDGHSYYLIHDLLHDLALSVASHECLVIHRVNVRSSKNRSSARHLGIHVDHADDGDCVSYESAISEILETKKIGRLQTLMVFGELDERFIHFLDDLIKEAKGLRILHLSEVCYSMEFSILPHLRYLSLGSIASREIHLPSRLSRFYHLRILDLKQWRGHLDLPRYMSNLRKLGHFLTQNDEVHSKLCNVGELQFLQELKRFRVNKENSGFELRQVGKLIAVRELGIYNLEKVHSQEDAIEANLIGKQYLQKLTLDWDTELPKNERDVEGLVLEKLEPQKNLQELRISGHGSGSCPTWLGCKLSVKVLRSLHLAGVEWEDLPSLGYMVVLRELTLEKIKTLKEFGPRHFGDITQQSFCNLKRLTLIDLEGLEKCVLGDHCNLLAQLEVLIIRDCRDLLGLPFVDSKFYPQWQDEERKILWFPNLQKLEIEKCPKVVSLPPIPWTPNLCYVNINGVGSSEIEGLKYTKQHSYMKLETKDDQCSLDKVLAFNNLTDLQGLNLKNCPPLELKHLQMLISLKSLEWENSGHLFHQSGNEGEVEWQLPIEKMIVRSCIVTGKELAQFLSHVPKLADLSIVHCGNITQMGVAVDQQQVAAYVPPSSASAVRMEAMQATCDKRLLLPAHLSDSLQELYIQGCPEEIDEVDDDDSEEIDEVDDDDSEEIDEVDDDDSEEIDKVDDDDSEEGKEGLQALRFLQRLTVFNCPNSLSSSCFPFPSSLKELMLWDETHRMTMGTLKPLANLTSLTELRLCGGHILRSDGLWHLVTQGQLSKLDVILCPRFFVGSGPIQGLNNDDQVRPSLHSLETDYIEGFFVAPICTILSSSLTKFEFKHNKEVVRFTKEQEEALKLLTSLQHLVFRTCGKLQCLPAGLHTLPKLKSLAILYCKLISSLPIDGLPSSLQELDVKFCGNDDLKMQCRSRMFFEENPRIKLII
ncbi:hypothetical protein EJB05_00193, partial [Eragrostis curvula]